MELIRTLFAEMEEISENPPTPPKSSGNLAMAKSSSTKSSLSLPLNPNASRVLDANMQRLLGQDAKAKPSDSGGLQPGSFLKKPDFQDKSYRITGRPQFSQAAAVPLSFRALQPAQAATKSHGVSLTNSEAIDLESQMKRMAIMLSHQDWFLGAVKNLIEKAIAASTDPPEQLSQALEMLQSGSKAGCDAQFLLGNLTFNWVLRRRDAYIRDTFGDLAAMARRTLRLQDLDDPQLFDPDTCRDVFKQYTDASLARAAHKAVQSRPNYSAPRPSVLDKSHPPQPKPSSSWSNKPQKGQQSSGQKGKNRSSQSTPYKKKGDGRKK